MCGISGIATSALDRPQLGATIHAMACALGHRGPDGTGIRSFHPPAVSRGVALAHNRLAIIDVSEAGREPMTNEDESLWLTFNGEIYNFQPLRERLERDGHRFRSHTDAEVILHLYEELGPACVKEFEGIFAFAILDLKHDLLFLARDPAGVKPLFYSASPIYFLFASEIKGLLASALFTSEVNWQAASDFFTFLYVPGPATMFQRIFQVPPGRSLSLRLSDLSYTLARFYEVRREPEIESSSYEDVKSRIRESLAGSVRRQLVSDVPLGLFLSGGIDSTIVAGLAKEAKADIHSYTLSVRGDAYRYFDESGKARAVSRHLGTQHRELELDPPDALDMLDLVDFFDQPFANPTTYLMFQLSRKAREHITVALCGAGGDELFAGYPRSRAVRLARRVGWIPSPLIKLSSAALGVFRDSHQTPHLRRARKFLAGLGGDFFTQYANWTYCLSEADKRALLHPQAATGGPPKQLHSSSDVLRDAFEESFLSELDNRILEMDVKTYLPGNILEYTDRMSMAVALEVRVPMLDSSFISLALNTPFAYKMRGGAGKAILADAFSEFFTPEARNAPKRGFSAPLGLWITQVLESYFDASQESSHPLRKRFGEDVGAVWREGILNFAFIQALRDSHRRGRRDASHELFACILFDLWWRKYIRQTQPIVHWTSGKERLCASSS
jgi:asparagine synthase (glutamine-hydrolysing)